MPKPRFQSNGPRSSTATGTFRDDGSFWHEATGRSQFHLWLEELVHRLRREFATPKVAAELIREHSEYRVEGEVELAQWDRLERTELWPCALVSTSAGEFVKRGVLSA
jgi:hypothetical protein